VHNRRSLGEFLERETMSAARNSRPIAVLLLDVDYFKQVNDRFGHPAGDAVLRALGERFRENARAEDLVARYGGEEFALALPETDLHRATVVGERCRRAVAQQPFRVDGQSIAVTVSVGAAAIEPRQTRTVEELLQEADERMYEGKRAGRNRVVPTPPEFPEHCVNTPAPCATREFQI
jgi:diguanylate cyclase (GGDEF)-like protein